MPGSMVWLVDERKEWKMTETSGRFIKVRSLEDEQGTEIWIDRETGVNYVFHSRGSAEGFTPLLDAEGNPVIAPLTAD